MKSVRDWAVETNAWTSEREGNRRLRKLHNDVICALQLILLWRSNRENVMGGHVACMAQLTTEYKVVLGKPEQKRQFRGSAHG
jgi:hypothetical protein